MTEQSPDLLAVLEAMPPREVLCFRGLRQARLATVGAEVVLEGPCVATTDAGVATENFTTPGLLAVLASGARRVVHRGRAHDAEVVLMPGTRLRVVGQGRSEGLVVTLVAEAGSEVTAEDVGRRAAQAVRRDRAHEPHPDLQAGRFVGELGPAPAGTWDPDALTSAERPDFGAMSREEVQAWYAERARSSAERFRDAPDGPVNPMKQRDYPHLRQVGWEVGYTPGRPCLMVRDGAQHPGRVVGLREGADGLVLVVDADGTWACARADGQVWADSVDALSGRADDRDVPVLATRLADAGTLSATTGRPVRATVRTAMDPPARGGRPR